MSGEEYKRSAARTHGRRSAMGRKGQRMEHSAPHGAFQMLRNIISCRRNPLGFAYDLIVSGITGHHRAPFCWFPRTASGRRDTYQPTCSATPPSFKTGNETDRPLLPMNSSHPSTSGPSAPIARGAYTRVRPCTSGPQPSPCGVSMHSEGMFIRRPPVLGSSMDKQTNPSIEPRRDKPRRVQAWTT